MELYRVNSVHYRVRMHQAGTYTIHLKMINIMCVMWCDTVSCYEEDKALPVSTVPLHVASKSKDSFIGTPPAAYTTLPSLLDSVAGNTMIELPTATVRPARRKVRRNRNRNRNRNRRGQERENVNLSYRLSLFGKREVAVRADIYITTLQYSSMQYAACNSYSKTADLHTVRTCSDITRSLIECSSSFKRGHSHCCRTHSTHPTSHPDHQLRVNIKCDHYLIHCWVRW